MRWLDRAWRVYWLGLVVVLIWSVGLPLLALAAPSRHGLLGTVSYLCHLRR